MIFIKPEELVGTERVIFETDNFVSKIMGEQKEQKVISIEIPKMEKFFSQFGDRLPVRLRNQFNELRNRLG